MNRLFQDTDGNITFLNGIRLSHIDILHDAADASVILLWIHGSESGQHFRIFIDCAYCGIDQYTEDEKASDDDDPDVVCWTNPSLPDCGCVITSAEMKTDATGATLSILTSSARIDLCRQGSEEGCSLAITPF